MRRMFLTALAFSSMVSVQARASEMSVTLDEVQTITFGVPVATVYVGNPSIADINMIDSRHAFILGKGYGSTNIVALDHKGVEVANTRINVLTNQSESTVTLNRGAARVTYSCTATHCVPTPQPGDGKATFDADNGQIGMHQEVAKRAAAAQ